MTKNTMTRIYNTLKDIQFINKEVVLAELEKELNRGAEEKAAKNAEYEQAWPVVAEGLRVIGNPTSVADLYAEIANDLPDGFSKNRVSYGLTHQWSDRVVKTEGKVNCYALRV